MKNIDITEQIEYIGKVKKLNEGKGLRYYILTMGCQLNENDSEKICGMLEEMAYTRTDEMKEADLVIFNTCCVRENAEEKLFGKLGEVKKIREQNGTIIAIGGCMMQEEHIVNKIKQSYQFDVIFGTHTMHKFPQDLYKAIMSRKRVTDVIDIDGEIIEGLPISRNDNIRASVTIMNGCNNFCSYCIVPYVRGRERSRNPKDILDEINDLAKKGYKEITLLGQNVNSYMRVEREANVREGVKEENKAEINTFAKLLIEVNKIEGIEKIRFVSPHPKDFTDDVIDAIAKCEKVSKLIHLPLQSGSTNVLKVMNRKYTKEQFLKLVEKMREKIPNVTFSTDIIVGFPGETEEDFLDTMDVVEQVRFDQIYMFCYSIRRGTRAERMDNQIDEKIKVERLERLKALFEKIIDEENEKKVGSIQNILVEGISKNNPNMYTGRTLDNKVVVFEGLIKDIGKMKKIEIVKNNKWYLTGKIVE